MDISTNKKPETVSKRRTYAGLTASAVLLAIAALIFWPEGAPVERKAVEDKAQAVGEEVGGMFTCSMHPHVMEIEPGDCPICGMRLEKVAASGHVEDTGGEHGGRRIKYWQAPMDPGFRSDSPGKSPMGMDLVPVYQDDGGSSSEVTISPSMVQNMGVRTAAAQRRRLFKKIRTVGSIDYDERLVRDVTTKFEGWIEKLFADYTGQSIDRGMALFSVYSPQLYSSQEEYLLALRSLEAGKEVGSPAALADISSLVESAKLRLRLFDISDEQIEELARRGEPNKTLTIVSPHSGIVVDKSAREGMHIGPGVKLYTIADLHRVWVSVDIYENEVPFVKLGQEADMELSYLPGQVFTGRVIYVYPFVATETRTVKVRLEVDNPHLLLKPGMFANVTINADLGREAVVVPRSAVIDTGRRKVAFVALGGGRFQPRQVETGLEVGDGDVEVSVVEAGEMVVTSGQFLLDSESKLREAVAKMLDGGEGQGLSGRPLTVNTEPTVAASGGGLAAALTDERAAALLAAWGPLLDSYLGLAAELARDGQGDLAGAVAGLAEPLEMFSAAASEDPAVDGLAQQAAVSSQRMAGRSLDVVRAQFTEFSRTMISMLATLGPTARRPRLKAFYCPMAGASWMQMGELPANPFYGFSMPDCGEEFVVGKGVGG